MIHTILILKNTGEAIYCRNLSNIKWDEQLTSGFISATFNFTQNTFDADIEDLELGPYKILFEKGKEIILIALFDKYDSIINVKEILIKINNYIHEKYSVNLKNYLCNMYEFKDLEQVVNEFIIDSERNIPEKLKEQYKNVLDSFRSNSEILDCDLISQSGIPLTKEWKEEFLDLCLRMIDAFWKSKQYVLDQIILSYEQRHLILHKINENLILSALIRKNTPLGIATFLVDETAKIIAKLE
ncbi:MAG: hypothetical protein ACTSQG_08735 [Promethearchaeota archaeon]